MIYFTSDEHYHHANILTYAGRPFNNVDHMNESMIAQHNAVVGEDDQVLHLGDFTFQKVGVACHILRRLKGTHFFIRGNHDKWNRQELPAKDVIEQCNTLIGSRKLIGIQDYYEMNPHGHHIVLCHFPMVTWHKSHRGSMHLHGHCHATLNDMNEASGVKRLDVGVDSAARHLGVYRPFSLTEVIAIMDKRVGKTIDSQKVGREQ